MNIEEYEAGMAAVCLLFDENISNELGNVLLEMSEKNAYYGVLFQLHKYIYDKNVERLFSAAKLLYKADVSKENKGALNILIRNIYVRYESKNLEFILNSLSKEYYIDWSKTNKNILIAIQSFAKEDYEKLKGRPHRIIAKWPD